MNISTVTGKSGFSQYARDERYNHLLIDKDKLAHSRSKLAVAHRRIAKVLRDLENRGPDEHGGWKTGITGDRKSFEAVNVDIYGLDVVNGQALGVVQVRQCYKKKSWGFSNVRKNYFLVGRNERTKSVFAHPIPAGVVHAAIRRDPSPQSPITAARAWVFEVDRSRLTDIIRHGDVALVPGKRLPVGEQTEQPLPVNVLDAHVLRADRAVRIGDRLYALNPQLHHEKNQHADVSGIGWYRVQVGLRASFWKFAGEIND